jgi:iron complex outermembrane recepter protein
MRFSKLLVSTAPFACAFVAGATAVAFVAEANAAEPQQTSAGIVEEIVVTSRREEEQIQDVPVSVSAFTQTDIQRIAPRTLVDFDNLMPNVSVSQQTAGPSMGAIFIRGLGTADVEKTVAPQVGLVLDGIFQANNTGQLVDTFDVDQVEVNRGPQGVLYGKNTTGGTIVVRRTQPQFNEYGLKVSAEMGDYNDQLYKARVNIPLIDDTLALKLAGASNTRDGFYQNQTRVTDDGNVDYKTYSASLKWQPVEEIVATAWYDNIDDNGNFGLPNEPIILPGNNPLKTLGDLKQTIRYNVDTWGLNVQWDLGNAMTLESITGYVSSKDVVRQDFDNATLATLAVPLPRLHTLRDQSFSLTSQELRLSGNAMDNMTYTLGALYYNTSLSFSQGTNQILQLPGVAFGLPAGTPCAAIPGFTDNPIPGVGNAFCQGPATGSFQITNQQDLSKAVYGAINYQLTDKLELSAGMRRLQQDISFHAGGFFPADIPAGSILPPNTATSPFPCGTSPTCPFPIDSDNSWNKTIAEATATFKMTDTNMVYARFSQGFRSGGFSNRGNNPAFLSFGPESANAYEIGSKNEFFDHRVQLNLTAFLTQVQDIQFTSILTTTGVPPGTNTIINNGGDTDIYGFEAQGAWLINDLFSITATYGYQDNSVDEFNIGTDRVPFDPASCNATTQTCRLGGQDLGRAPKYNYSVTGVYTQDFGPYNVTASVSARGQDDIILVGGATSAAAVTQDAYTLYDARIALQWNMENHDLLRLSFIGKNLSDKDYLQEALPLAAAGLTQFAGGFQGWGPPRTYAVELLYQM